MVWYVHDLTNWFKYQNGYPENILVPLGCFSCPWGQLFSLKWVFLHVLLSWQFNDIILLHNNVFIMFVLHFFSYLRKNFRHPNGHNNKYIMLVLHMSHQSYHKYVLSKVLKSMLPFMSQILYISTIHFFQSVIIKLLFIVVVFISILLFILNYNHWLDFILIFYV